MFRTSDALNSMTIAIMDHTEIRTRGSETNVNKILIRHDDTTSYETKRGTDVVPG